MGSNKQKLLQFFIYLNDNGQLVVFMLFLNWIFVVFIPRKEGREKQKNKQNCHYILNLCLNKLSLVSMTGKVTKLKRSHKCFRT